MLTKNQIQISPKQKQLGNNNWMKNYETHAQTPSFPLVTYNLSFPSCLAQN